MQEKIYFGAKRTTYISCYPQVGDQASQTATKPATNINEPSNPDYPNAVAVSFDHMPARFVPQQLLNSSDDGYFTIVPSF